MAFELLIEPVDTCQFAETNLRIIERYGTSHMVRDDLFKVLRLESLTRNRDAFQAENLRGRLALLFAG